MADGRRVAGRRKDQVAELGDAGLELGGRPGLSFREVGGFLTAGVVFAFGAAFFVGRLVAGEQGGSHLHFKVGLEPFKNGGAETGAVDHAEHLGQRATDGQRILSARFCDGRRSQAEQVVDAIYQGAWAEGLGHVVERAEFQADVLGVRRRPSSENDDGDGRGFGLAPEDFADPETVDVRQHEIENQQVGFFQGDRIEGGSTIGRRAHEIARFTQMKRNQRGDVILIVYAENRGGHSLTLTVVDYDHAAKRLRCRKECEGPRLAPGSPANYSSNALAGRFGLARSASRPTFQLPKTRRFNRAR